MRKTQDFQERVIVSLRSLYNSHGYSHYRMSKFEEYDLYARNKDFLISDRAITFTDTNGKLMALKPDVTLSIVKNTRDSGSTQKLYYNENVYRVTKNSRTFREIMQVGLECLGQIDDFCLFEVLYLAGESLRQISSPCVLEISHLGVLSRLLDRLGIPEDRKEPVLRCIGQKNLHELERLCRGLSPEDRQLLLEAVGTSGPLLTVLPRIRQLLDDPELDRLLEVARSLEAAGLGDILRFDFSVVDNIRYYNGIVFKGFLEGIPSSVLSGGQYDKLMGKLGRKAGAIGFAVYMDALERLEASKGPWDTDVLLLYEPGTPLEQIQKTAQSLREAGQSVLAQQSLPENLRWGKLLKIRGSEVETVETNA